MLTRRRLIVTFGVTAVAVAMVLPGLSNGRSRAQRRSLPA